jgi:hypothetical protein
MKLKDRYKGLHTHRFDRNPMERAFAEAWQDLCENRATGFTASWETGLAQLLRQGEANFSPSPRDYRVAATVIQWLGSPVGQDFMEEAIEFSARSAHEGAVTARKKSGCRKEQEKEQEERDTDNKRQAALDDKMRRQFLDNLKALDGKANWKIEEVWDEDWSGSKYLEIISASACGMRVGLYYEGEWDISWEEFEATGETLKSCVANFRKQLNRYADMLQRIDTLTDD